MQEGIESCAFTKLQRHTEPRRDGGEAAISGTERRIFMMKWKEMLWLNDEGQDIAEYAVMLAVILIIVIGTVRLIGGNSNNVFSQVASGIQ